MNTAEAAQAAAIFWGIFLVGSYFPALISKRFLSVLMLEKQTDGFVIMAASLQIVIGAASLAVNNRWELGLAGIITVLGWMAVVKGVGRYMALGLAEKAAKNMPAAVAYPYLLIHLAVGCFLLYRGFVN
ncbi:hypothetical protein HGA13_18595 [Nocardia speluncae]|uniref:Uncharacterized protein n=1 Tax=Nocardia speluncae TaxID=419477 RepID=A0A846XGF8_9NOCA|nr:hypothetical protein [Nocardia speluncae]NKY35062.1 hypothetical protein [Nocardia speluncae]